ncbi:hypothetical protein ScPMuIL_014066 [Solemya velum]
MTAKQNTEPPDKHKTLSGAKTGLEKGIEPKCQSIVIRIGKWIFWISAVLVGLAAVICGYYISVARRIHYRMDIDSIPEAVLDQIGVNGAMMFLMFDQDGDGYISIEEFQPLLQSLTGSTSNVSGGFDMSQPIVDGDQVITVQVYFQQLQLESMSKDTNRSMHNSLDPLAGLKRWTKPTTDWMNFAVRHFQVFFPNNPQLLIDVGEVYGIIEAESSGLWAPLHLPSHRYFPPKVETDVMAIHRLLSLFHPRPFILTRFGPQGSAACIRAYNNDYLDIVFRIHAEFQLHEPPHYPFWFSPAQFTGHIVVSRDYEQIMYFQMFVPNDKKLNVDMEWMHGPREDENMEVDIGYLPLMELNSTAPSVHLTEEKPYLSEIPVAENKNIDKIVKNIKWTESITMEEARRKLETKFYPFLEVPYYNITTAFSLAEKENKLVHSILLWGEYFVNSWSLVADLELLKNDSAQPEIAQIATDFLENYKFPVMMMVALPNGTIINTVNANDFLDMDHTTSIFESGFSDPSTYNYVKFLKQGISDAEPFMNA